MPRSSLLRAANIRWRRSMKTKRKLAVAASTLAGRAAMARTSVGAAMTSTITDISLASVKVHSPSRRACALCVALASNTKRTESTECRRLVAAPYHRLAPGILANLVILDGTPDGGAGRAALGIDYMALCADRPEPGPGDPMT